MASEKQFATFVRGHVRDNITLAKFRNCLRAHTNPATGAMFTEDEIARATQPGSRFWIEADADDLMLQAVQARAAWVADQQIPGRASDAFLDGYHGPKWLGKDSRLPATGASGTVRASAPNGSIFPGSTTIGDPTAATATDPNGYTYQATEDTEVISGNSADVPLTAVDTGDATNVDYGTIFTWSASAPLGAAPDAESLYPGFDGGYPSETSAEYAARITDRIKHRPASGNPAHFMAWARESSVGVEYAFIYPIALDLGTVVVCLTGKRTSSDTSPTARLDPGKTVMTAATNYLVPPDSPVVPDDPMVLVVKPSSQPADITLRLDMRKGSSAGWYNTSPWPNPSEESARHEMAITSVVSSTSFQFECEADLPGGATSLTGDDAPSLMQWIESTSSFESLSVSSVSKSGNTCTVVLSGAPTTALAVGTRISPFTEMNEQIVAAVVGYFDGIGPGELHDLTTRSAGQRGARFPAPGDSYPSSIGQQIVSPLTDAVGSVVSDIRLDYASRYTPDLPGQIIDGPNMITLGAMTLIPM